MESHAATKHSQVVVAVGEWREAIDEALAPLIREIWIAGIETMMCCQEVEEGIAWIEFPTVEEFLRFLNLVTTYERGSDTFYNRVSGVLVGPQSLPSWTYQLNLVDLFQGEIKQAVSAVCFDATVGVYFPLADIPWLLPRLRERSGKVAVNERLLGL